MSITRHVLRRIVRKTIKETLDPSQHFVPARFLNSKKIQAYVLFWCRAVDEYYSELTVDDVLTKIQADTRLDIGEFKLWKFVDEGSEEANFLLEIDYDDLVTIMHQMVQAGTLSDGYEDFFELGENQ